MKMTRILILGGVGMLGHKLAQTFRGEFDTWTTLRGPLRRYERFGIFDPRKTLTGVDVADFDTVVGAVGASRPDVIINCIGIIKQLPTAEDPIVSLSVNSLLPHRLQRLAQAAGARLIHVSTDCVFRAIRACTPRTIRRMRSTSTGAASGRRAGRDGDVA
jgi:dTDP-4-dehydrorhamnose reductase